MIVEVFLSKALICFAGMCHPALVGNRTPTGTFPLKVIPISKPQYGGDVIRFAPDGPKAVFAIHRPPSARRRQLLKGERRTGITLGCINVQDHVYEQLKPYRQVRIHE